MGHLPDRDDFILWIEGLYPRLSLCFPYSDSTACVLLLEPSLLCLHSRDEPTGTTRATSRLTAMLNNCLVPAAPCHWRHKQGSWWEGRQWERGEGEGETSIPVNMQHWSYGVRSMPRKHWVFRRQSCQCLKTLLFRKHRLTNLEANVCWSNRGEFSQGQGKVHTMYKGTSPMPNFKPLLQILDFLNEISLPLISCLETVVPV